MREQRVDGHSDSGFHILHLPSRCLHLSASGQIVIHKGINSLKSPCIIKHVNDLSLIQSAENKPKQSYLVVMKNLYPLVPSVLI